GCKPGEACVLPREIVGHFADLAQCWSPEQCARLSAALRSGEGDPLSVWRDIEAENLAEAEAVRIPAFLRCFGSAAERRWNPVEMAMFAPLLGGEEAEDAADPLGAEASGPFDDLGGALGSVLGAFGGGGGAAPGAEGAGGSLSSLGGALGGV